MNGEGKQNVMTASHISFDAASDGAPSVATLPPRMMLCKPSFSMAGGSMSQPSFARTEGHDSERSNVLTVAGALAVLGEGNVSPMSYADTPDRVLIPPIIAKPTHLLDSSAKKYTHVRTFAEKVSCEGNVSMTHINMSVFLMQE